MRELSESLFDQTVQVINTRFEGAGARSFDNGEGLRISINCGDAIEIAESFSNDSSGLPDGVYLEPVNMEVLGVYPSP